MKQLLLVATLLLTSCATMVNGKSEQIPVKSEPPGAVVTVECGNAPVYGGLTPAVVTLERKADPCSLTIAKEGFAEEHVTLVRTTSLATSVNKVGGVVTGAVFGLLGYLLLDDDRIANDAFDGGMALGTAPGDAIDRHTGAAYKHVPGEVFVKLRPAEAAP